MFKGKMYELPKPQLRLVLFLMAFIEYGFHILWVSLIVSSNENRVLYGMVVTLFWDTMHDSYYTLGTDTWRDVWTRRSEKLGSCLGAGVSLYLFPHL